MPRAKAAPAYEDLVARMRELHARLVRARRSVASAESCTGGLLGAILTAHGGSSTFYRGGVVPYTDDAKTLFADVPAHLIHAHGAVSAAVAQALAAGVRKRLGADIGLGVTGIAGPGGATRGKPVGLVYVAVDSDAHSRTKKARFGHDREGNRRASVALALDLLADALKQSAAPGAGAPVREAQKGFARPDLRVQRRVGAKRHGRGAREGERSEPEWLRHKRLREGSNIRSRTS